MPLRHKILIIFLVFVIVPFVLIFAYYDYSSQRTVQTQVGKMAGQTVEQTTIAINDRIRMMEKALLSASNNSSILDMLLPREYEILGLSQIDLPSMKHFYNSIIFTNTYIKTIRIDLYENDTEGENQTFLFGAGSGDTYSPLNVERYVRYFRDRNLLVQENLPEYRDNPVYRQAVEMNGDILWSYGLFPDDDNLYVLKQFAYLSYSQKIGTILFVVDPDLLRELCNDTPDLHHYIFDQSQQLLTGQADTEDLDALVTVQLPKAGTSQTINDQLVTSQPLVNGWRYVHTVSIPSLMKDIRQTRGYVLSLASLLLVVLLLVVSLLIRHFDRQLQVLLKKFESVEKGDMVIRQHLDSQDELGKLDRHFNHMVEQLQRLIHTNYISQLEKREVQLDALKFQINPHFLYNTLNVISSIATIHKTPSIPAICQNLSQLFRYNMSGHSNVSLKQELDSVRNFISLQQVQFTEPFQVFFDIEPGVETCAVQKFVLQPIVENAIKYGFAKKDRVYCLEINAHADGDLLVIEVADDGEGMSPEDLSGIKASLEQSGRPDAALLSPARPGRNSIGLPNIHERLRLAYGKSSGLEIQSELGSGTTVTLKMPLKERKSHA